MAAKAAVDKHNAEADQGLHTYWKQVNDFAIMVQYLWNRATREVTINEIITIMKYCQQTDDEKKLRMGLVLPDLNNSQVRTHVTSRQAPPASVNLKP